MRHWASIQWSIANRQRSGYKAGNRVTVTSVDANTTRDELRNLVREKWNRSLFIYRLQTQSWPTITPLLETTYFNQLNEQQGIPLSLSSKTDLVFFQMLSARRTTKFKSHPWICCQRTKWRSPFPFINIFRGSPPGKEQELWEIGLSGGSGVSTETMWMCSWKWNFNAALFKFTKSYICLGRVVRFVTALISKLVTHDCHFFFISLPVCFSTWRRPVLRLLSVLAGCICAYDSIVQPSAEHSGGGNEQTIEPQDTRPSGRSGLGKLHHSPRTNQIQAHGVPFWKGAKGMSCTCWATTDALSGQSKLCPFWCQTGSNKNRDKSVTLTGMFSE